MKYLMPVKGINMFVLRAARKKFPNKILNCRSFGGNVTIFMNRGSSSLEQDGSQRVIVNSREKLEQLLTEELSTTINDICDINPFDR